MSLALLVAFGLGLGATVAHVAYRRRRPRRRPWWRADVPAGRDH